MSQAESQQVEQFLARTVEEGETPSSQKLTFDPSTGELVVQRSTQNPPNPDAVVADQIAEEGFFFAKPSFVYMHEDQIQNVYQKWENSAINQFSAVAFGFDGGDVFHVYTSHPKTHFSGFPVASIIYFLPQMIRNDEGFTLAQSIINSQPRQTQNIPHSIVILLAIEEEKLNHRVFISQADGSLSEGIIKFIPQRCELYSRSHGLLETSVLEQCRVGIVGLGSGGASVAIELAKAGVGKFVLIDFDRLELANVSRHVCGTGDLGRYKTKAVKDLLYGKNPYVQIETAEIDVNTNFEQTKLLLKNCDLIIGASDNNRSRFNLNNIALEYKITTIFGRALTRACGGDVLRVRPFQGPCLACVFTKEFLQSRQEEISSFRQARDDNPAYVSNDQVEATIQVGLSSDIVPISNMIVKLALQELSRDKDSGIKSLEEDLIADFYIWANRRENTYESWPKMEYGSKTPSILRWYGAKWERDVSCQVCGNSWDSTNPDDNFFG
ncbi:ThiF family adenylyltransferase [Spirulina subsalsa FACHB-351]|uniref:ThiF family adenylyltransferase n=1 Tax=Spirulina subsalsa FACHB-351 TaxID=234711 RepID=A0ABT3L1Q9_9CYAN|nr:ThiF family adenylyltransferase [Spirulina subsalsa]MCW6035400.1 ThiF family adenylyltransferase [Spirulina subsalsa FACHB-351]